MGDVCVKAKKKKKNLKKMEEHLSTRLCQESI